MGGVGGVSVGRARAWARALATAATVVVAAAGPHALAAPKAAATPALPPPPLTLVVTPGQAGTPWKVRVENAGEVPFRIVADPRLLELEITAPATATATAATATAAAKPVRCALPDDARPATDEAHELVLPGRRSWSTSVDPIFLCFGARERAALASGATVKARFGFAAPKDARGRASAPFAADPVGAAIGLFAPAKAIDGAPFVLADAVPAVPASPNATGGSDAGASAEGAPTATAGPRVVTLAMPDVLDVARGSEIQATITATNESSRPVTLLFRPEVLALRVTGPGGSVTCGTPRTIDAPIRELFTTLAPKGRASLALLLTAICPPDTFDDAGVYRVFPRIDTTGASGRPLGLRTWDGEAEGRAPLLLRVRSRRRAQPPARPLLDERT